MVHLHVQLHAYNQAALRASQEARWGQPQAHTLTRSNWKLCKALLGQN